MDIGFGCVSKGGFGKWLSLFAMVKAVVFNLCVCIVHKHTHTHAQAHTRTKFCVSFQGVPKPKIPVKDPDLSHVVRDLKGERVNLCLANRKLILWLSETVSGIDTETLYSTHL